MENTEKFALKQNDLHIAFPKAQIPSLHRKYLLDSFILCPSSGMEEEREAVPLLDPFLKKLDPF